MKLSDWLDQNQLILSVSRFPARVFKESWSAQVENVSFDYRDPGDLAVGYGDDPDKSIDDLINQLNRMFPLSANRITTGKDLEIPLLTGK